jgi:hypothetical protein
MGGKETIEQKPSSSWDYTPCPFGEIQGILFFMVMDTTDEKRICQRNVTVKRKRGLDGIV